MKKTAGLYGASLLAALSAGIHLFVGGPQIAGPLLESSLALEPKLVLYACWHLVSWALALSAVALLWAARTSDARAARPLVRFLGALWTGFGLVFLAVAAARPEPGLFLLLPQWAILLPTGLLALLSADRASPTSR